MTQQLVLTLLATSDIGQKLLFIGRGQYKQGYW